MPRSCRCRRTATPPEENAAIKAGEVPGGWAENPAKLRQKDLDARWTKKHGQSHYGYKNHINIDRTHKLVREYTVTDAARHDSQELEAAWIRITRPPMFGPTAPIVRRRSSKS